MAEENSSLLTTTQLYDSSDIYTLDVNKEEFKDFLVTLYNLTTTIIESSNSKDSAYYIEDRFVTGQKFFPNPAKLVGPITDEIPYRDGLRRAYLMPALPNNGQILLAHQIAPTNAFTVTRIYGGATDPATGSFVPIPFAFVRAIGAIPGMGAGSIQLITDNTNIYIDTAGNWTAYTVVVVVIEWLED